MKALRNLSILLMFMIAIPSMTSCGGGKAIYGVRKQSGFRKCNSRAVRHARYGELRDTTNTLPLIIIKDLNETTGDRSYKPADTNS